MILYKMGYGGSFADSAKVALLSNDEGIDGIIYEDKLCLGEREQPATGHEAEIPAS